MSEAKIREHSGPTTLWTMLGAAWRAAWQVFWAQYAGASTLVITGKTADIRAAARVIGHE